MTTYDRRVLALVIGVIFVLCLQVAVATSPLHQADERAHASYATVLAHGQLPTVDTPMPDEPERYPRLAHMLEGRDQAHRSIWVANHPPLYYALSVPLVWLGDAVGSPNLTYLGMRVLNALGFVVTAVLAALIAGELVPRRRREVVLLAAGLALSCGSIPYRGGGIYNDGIATATAFWVLLVGLRTVRQGVTRRSLAAITVAAAAAAASRPTGLVAVALGCAAVVVAYAIHERSGRGILRGVLAAVPVGLVPAAAIGWFYVRNVRLYGSLTGSQTLFDKFGRTPDGSTLGELVDPVFYWDLFRSLWTDELIHNVLLVVPVLVLVAMVAALVVEVRSRGGLAATWAQRRAHVGRTDIAVWVLTLGYVAILVDGTASFVAEGGWLHARYAIPLLPLVGAGFAAAVLRLAAVSTRSTEKVVRTTLLALLAAALVAHIALELRLDPPVRNAAILARILIGDGAVVAVSVVLVRTLRGQSSAQSARRTTSTYGPGRAKASG